MVGGFDTAAGPLKPLLAPFDRFLTQLFAPKIVRESKRLRQANVGVFLINGSADNRYSRYLLQHRYAL